MVPSPTLINQTLENQSIVIIGGVNWMANSYMCTQ